VRDIVDACRFAFKWGLLFAIVAAVGVGFYLYTRMNDVIRVRVQAKLAAGYPNLHVEVRSAQLIDGKGIEVRGVVITDPRVEGSAGELAYFDEMMLCSKTNWKELVQQHEPIITKIILRRPQIQALHLPDGTWSAGQLLPLPKLSDHSPDMTIESGQMIVVDPRGNTPTPFMLRDINLEIKPVDREKSSGPDASTIAGYLSADHVQRVDISGRINRGGGLDINGSVNGIDVSPELMAVLPPEYADRIAPIAPLRGQAKLAEFHVRHDSSQPQPWQFSVKGQLISGRFEDPRLPQALADMQVDFRCDNQGIVIDRLAARNGPTRIQMQGQMAGFQTGAPMVFEGEATHLLIGRQWEAILPEKLLEQWHKFFPAGEINVRQLRVVFDGNRWRLDGTVECLNVSFTFYKFPYRLDRATGTLTLKNDTATNQNQLALNLTAFAGGRPVKIDGEFLNPGPEFTGAVEMHGDNLPLDQNLYAAMTAAQPKSSEVVQSLNPAGTFNFWVRSQRNDPHQQLMNQHLVVTLNRCSVCYDKFRYPMYNVTGTLEMVDGHWTFRELAGSNHAGHVTCEGRLTPVPEGFDLFLQFRGHDLVLEEDLRDALNPRMQRLWNELKPRGSFNLALAEVGYKSADKRLTVTTRVEPVGDTVSIEPTFFRYRLEKLQGAINFRDGRADLENLRAVHERTSLGSNGYCEYTPDGNWHMRLENLAIDRLRLDRDRDLIAALPPRLRKAAEQLSPTGLVGLNGSVEWWGNSATPPADPAPGSPDECKVRTAWNVEFDLQQAGLRAGLDLKNVNGSVKLNGQCDGQQFHSNGELNVDSITWNGFQFTEVNGPFRLDDHQVILGSAAENQPPARAARHVSAKAYGGAVTADATVLLEEVPRYSAQVVISDGDLARFCTDAIPGRQTLKGKMEAGVDLSGTAAGLHTLRGQGEVKLHDADIYRLPVMVALLKILNFKPPDSSAFSTSDIKFHIDGEHVLLNNIEFSGDAISLLGKGEMNLNTDIQLTLHSLVGRSDMELPAFKRMMGGASEQIMQIRITGTLADPKAKREAFPKITEALQSIQGGMQPQDRTLTPQGMRLQPASDDTQKR
jgi:hypothetical protein